MTENEMKAEIRFFALELMVCNLLAIDIVASGYDPQSLLQVVRNQIIEGAQKMSLPGIDSAKPDMIAGELELAADRLLDLASEQIKEILPRQ